jgi:hypothetical protein
VGPYSRVYDVGHAGHSICKVMSVPAFRATVLAMLIQKVEAPEGDGWSLGSLPGWFGGAACLASKSDGKSLWRVTLKISLFRWVAPPLQPGVVGPLYSTGCMAPQLFAARLSRTNPHPHAVISVPWYRDNLPRQYPQCLPFEWVTKKCPLNGRRNRCSHATVGTSVDSVVRFVGLKPP